MPLEYTIDRAHRLITITGEYAVADEWRVLLAAILCDPAWRPGLGFLRDLRQATQPVDAPAVIGIMDVVKQFWPSLRPSRAAVLTPREFDTAALAAHALADTHGLPLRMFTSYEAAIEWLREGLVE